MYTTDLHILYNVTEEDIRGKRDQLLAKKEKKNHVNSFMTIHITFVKRASIPFLLLLASTEAIDSITSSILQLLQNEPIDCMGVSKMVSSKPGERLALKSHHKQVI